MTFLKRFSFFGVGDISGLITTAEGMEFSFFFTGPGVPPDGSAGAGTLGAFTGNKGVDGLDLLFVYKVKRL